MKTWLMAYNDNAQTVKLEMGVDKAVKLNIVHLLTCVQFKTFLNFFEDIMHIAYFSSI